METIETKNSKTARLEARVSAEEKELLQYAADLQGRSLTEFLVSCAHDAAQKTVQEHEILELSAKDRKAFVSAILRPPAPGKRLKKAARRYKDTMGIQ